jgi:Uma2 family endonuclease
MLSMNVALSQVEEILPRRTFTVEDVRRMIDAHVLGEGERIELVEGDLIMMAAKGIAHERIKLALVRAIVRAAPDDLIVGIETTLRLTDTVMVEPDIAVFPRSVFRKSASGFARLDPGEARLVIEVAVSSLAYDKELKARLYAGHHVQEFWVVDANERVTWVHTGPGPDGWSSIVEHRQSETLVTPALPDFSIRLKDID